jgi:hypothetical protein
MLNFFCYNKKREKLIVPIVPTKVVESIAEVTTQLVKPTIIPLKYPYIICSSFENHAPDYPKKIEV